MNLNMRRKQKISGESAPCIHCTKLIKKCGIKKIKYIDHQENIVSVNTSNYHTDHISTGCKILLNRDVKVDY